MWSKTKIKNTPSRTNNTEQISVKQKNWFFLYLLLSLFLHSFLFCSFLVLSFLFYFVFCCDIFEFNQSKGSPTFENVCSVFFVSLFVPHFRSTVNFWHLVNPPHRPIITLIIVLNVVNTKHLIFSHYQVSPPLDTTINFGHIFMFLSHVANAPCHPATTSSHYPLQVTTTTKATLTHGILTRNTFKCLDTPFFAWPCHPQHRFLGDHHC